jgi:hypothetical protein
MLFFTVFLLEPAPNPAPEFSLKRSNMIPRKYLDHSCGQLQESRGPSRTNPTISSIYVKVQLPFYHYSDKALLNSKT